MIFRVLAVTATALALACPATAFAHNNSGKNKRATPAVLINGAHPLNPQPLPPLKVPLARTAE